MKQKKKEKSQKEAFSDKNQLEELGKEKQEIFEKLQRVSADYANFQKRIPRQTADAIAYEKEKIIKSLLPALDNFEHILANARTAENVEVLIDGIRMVYGQMLDILKSHDVEQIVALDEQFNPEFHQAMLQKYEPEKDAGVVLEEFQKGYKLNSRVIRPSKVIVNKSAQQESQLEETSEKDSVEDDLE